MAFDAYFLTAVLKELRSEATGARVETNSHPVSFWNSARSRPSTDTAVMIRPNQPKSLMMTRSHFHSPRAMSRAGRRVGRRLSSTFSGAIPAARPPARIPRGTVMIPQRMPLAA